MGAMSQPLSDMIADKQRLASLYPQWRLAVEHLAGSIRFERLLAYGYAYNYRLWIRGPLLRLR